MRLSSSGSFGSALQMAALASFLLFGAACSGGGGNSPTEPAPPAPEILVLHVSWEYDVGLGPVAGVTHPIAGNPIHLHNVDGAYCEDIDGWIVCYPDVAECRTTYEGGLQAYYHDTFAGDQPGALGPLVTSGCSIAEQYGFYTKCCLVDP